MQTRTPTELPATASPGFAEFFDPGRWMQWLTELDRGFLFLLLLPLVVAAVGLWAHFFGDDREK